MNQNTVALTLENFRPVMVEQSALKLVVVYFWAQWDEPSVAQLELIKSFVSQYPDEIFLASVNCDEQAEIVQQFGVKGLPTTILVKDGQPVDGFSGPQDEAQLKVTFAEYLPKPEDELFSKAKELVAQADYQGAFTFLKQAHDIDATRADITIMYSDACVETGTLAQAKALIGSVGLVDQNGDYQAVLGKIKLAEKAAESPQLIELQEKHSQSPDDLSIKVELAVQLQQAHQPEQALSLLLEVVKKDLGFGDAKKTMLDMINALADGDPIKSAYRRRLYSLLY
jgi:putative thioredoxin